MTKILIKSYTQIDEESLDMIILFIFETIFVLENEHINVENLYWDISTTNYGSIFPNILEYF